MSFCIAESYFHSRRHPSHRTLWQSPYLVTHVTFPALFALNWAAATRLAAHRVRQFVKKINFESTTRNFNAKLRHINQYVPIFRAGQDHIFGAKALTALRNVVKDQEARRQGSTICYRRRCCARIHNPPAQESTSDSENGGGKLER